MTIEEIEARWKAATPVNAWAADDRRASAPTDIAYLLDRVRRLERAHAWFVEHNATNDSSFGCEVCLGSGGDDTTLGHQDSCEWVKAKELKL